jgi:hypothetical protein
MDAEQLAGHTTWRWLWEHTARQIIAGLALPPSHEPVALAYAWGVRNRDTQATLLLLHPSGASHGAGDLALTVAGQASAVISRDGLPYVEYVERASKVVARALQGCLASEAADIASHP